MALARTSSSPNLNVTTDAFLETLPAPARLSPRELAITSITSIPEIFRNYQSGQFSAEE
jgi:hypothetical protein